MAPVLLTVFAAGVLGGGVAAGVTAVIVIAATALVAATVGRGTPGAYNLAGEGTITLSDVAKATGRHAIPVPRILLGPASIGANLPLVPTLAQWVNAGRTPVLMDTAKARRELGWQPRYDTRQTLAALTE